ncbi:DUF4917 family protein [Nitratidesulfovibrio vulgaris]|uniref:DUF4917 domain-containing protein n=1 Tax=Nitratidesulfovibrio vulgaris (strain DP4) TaxID=391774 RepID=A0A0H3A8D7_NITV4|nr:DUF4917 family protein [Nitratidesulfovibrio vulgaris]ABM28494.1 conserved hypothetical protein [Nitratidesulfovibrio vulgaris DP4]
MPLVNFDEAVESVADTRKILLLGNGFSIAYSGELFAYSSLYSKAILDNNRTRLQRVFDVLNTMDFELVMNTLEGSAKISELYDCKSECFDEMMNDIDELRDSLVEVIIDSHPEHRRVINEEQYNRTNTFLSRFDCYYTTNYDFLFYWCLFGGANPICRRVNDGFTREDDTLKWRPCANQNLFYLHGALHLYHEHTTIKKLCYSEGVLRDQVRENIVGGRFPMVVAEGTSLQKLERIESNKYLSYAYSSLCRASGVIFIHGHSLSDNDDHIWNAISANRDISELYVGLYGDENSNGNLAIKDKARRIAMDRNVIFYASQSAQLW